MCSIVQRIFCPVIPKGKKMSRLFCLLFFFALLLFVSSPAAAEITHKPGVRPPRPDNVTITDIRSTKVHYDENEDAVTMATIVNTSSNSFSGTLIALMRVDLDTVREIARTDRTIGPVQTQTWWFSYNVGPETYGRGIEVRFVDAAETLLGLALLPPLS